MTIPIVALDVPAASDALDLVDALGADCRFYKVGAELFTAEGPSVVRSLRERGADVFLDLKLHDIPNTVSGAVRRAAALGVRLITVHAAGGSAMLREAQSAVAGGGCGLLAVTVLTSLDTAGLAEVWGRALPGLEVEREVLRLSELAAEAGLHGVVCSGREAAAVGRQFGGRLATLVPGVRLAGAEAHDQARVVTPAQAAAAGAGYVVLGRTVTRAADPRAAMKSVLSELASTQGAGYS